MEAHALQHLLLAVFVGEVVERLDEEQPNHDLGGVRRATASCAIRARTRSINPVGDGREVHQLVHGRQVGDEAAQLGLVLFLHKQVDAGLPAPEGLMRVVIMLRIVPDYALTV